MSLLSIRGVVTLAMHKAVLRTGVFSEANYTEAIVPGKPPMHGWGANVPNWQLVLDKCGEDVEANGHVWPFLSEEFVARTLSVPLADTNNELAQAIHQGAAVS
ncbi:MAG TPA: hypothetical protein VMW68_10220 [Methyloceanibacter sp.]|nr:hypothetical protein [Methyloceanibacter sp.]